MSIYFTAAVETALKFSMITVSEALDMGISEEALQQIENDKINDAVRAKFWSEFEMNERFESELGDINNL